MSKIKKFGFVLPTVLFIQAAKIKEIFHRDRLKRLFQKSVTETSQDQNPNRSTETLNNQRSADSDMNPFMPDELNEGVMYDEMIKANCVKLMLKKIFCCCKVKMKVVPNLDKETKSRDK